MATIESFTASNTSLNNSGGTISLNWQTTNADTFTVTSSPILAGLPTVSGDVVTISANTTPAPKLYTFTLTAEDSQGSHAASETLTITVEAQNPVKIVRFRLIDFTAKPLSFAFITAKLAPTMTNARNMNTVFPSVVNTRTNQLGFAELKLYANDVLATNSKYAITISYNGKNYYFLIRLEESMANLLDFEELINRSQLEQLRSCNSSTEGQYKIRGSKYYY